MKKNDKSASLDRNEMVRGIYMKKRKAEKKEL